MLIVGNTLYIAVQKIFAFQQEQGQPPWLSKDVSFYQWIHL